MEHRRFGKTGFEVPVIGMGTWKTFNVQGDRDESIRQEVVNRAYLNEASFFDSSPMYGEAERVLGATVKHLAIRDKVMIATKVWTESDEESQRQFQNAFDYFGGYVDFYQVHNLVAWQKRLKTLEGYKADGRVKAIGITHYSRGAFDEMRRVMETGQVDGVQIPYNALDREVEKVLLPLAESLNLAVVVMRPFGEGALLRLPPSKEELAAFEHFGVNTWPQVLLKWIASDLRVSVIIPATSRPEKMVENTRAGNPPWFDAETRERVNFLVKRYNG